MHTEDDQARRWCAKGVPGARTSRARERLVIAVCAHVPQPLETREGADSWLMEANGVFDIRLAPHTLLLLPLPAQHQQRKMAGRRAASGFVL